MERRKLLANVVGTVGIAGFAGCLTGSDGGEEDAGEQETLEPATDEETTADTDGSDDSDDSNDETATANEDGDETATETTTEEPATIEFDAEVEEINKCGETCRELVYALLNRGDKTASDVTVNIKIFTDGEKLWDNDQEVGELGAQSKRSGILREIDVGLSGGRKIKSNDGDIVIELTPSSDGVSETFEFEATLDV